jgi:hypothetical protein
MADVTADSRLSYLALTNKTPGGWCSRFNRQSLLEVWMSGLNLF